jgi:ATP synthase protein I
MPDRTPLEKLPPAEQRMIRQVREREAQVARSRSSRQSIWKSIAVLGTVGWSVTIPTIVGVALGLWLDRRWPMGFSWTLTLLTAGLVIGCVNAWLRIKEQP